jgi:dTDP-N-acetylfucosamine:lipid II N-acetylfucosaminyltransferase
LNKEEFNNLYLDTIALVINGYRQMAMGNIFEAFKNGTKVYLNEKNIILKWLREEGFLLSSIDDFAFDLKNELIELNENEITHNQNQLIKLASKYSQKDLFKALDGITNKSIK